MKISTSIFFGLILIYFVESNNNSTEILNVSNSTNITNNTKYNSSVSCELDSQCNYGYCSNSTKMCICNEGYVDYKTKFNSTINSSMIFPCYYKQKSQLIAFIYEMILGFGSEQFYLNNKQYAFAKLCWYILALLLIISYPLMLNFMANKLHSQNLILCNTLFYIFLGFIFFFIYFYDLISIYDNKIKDGNGYNLTVLDD
jgi:hypothetical protein